MFIVESNVNASSVETLKSRLQKWPVQCQFILMVHKAKIKFQQVPHQCRVFFDEIKLNSDIRHFNDENIKVASLSDINLVYFLEWRIQDFQQGMHYLTNFCPTGRRRVPCTSPRPYPMFYVESTTFDKMGIILARTFLYVWKQKMLLCHFDSSWVFKSN